MAETHSVHLGEPDREGKRKTPWLWVPTVNFAQGLQYAIVIQLFVIIFKTMGVSNGDTVFWGSLLGLPWTLKPLWSPIVDRYWTKRAWTIWMQFSVGIGLLATGFALLIPTDQMIGGMPAFLFVSLIFLFIVATASATHDIACDGYYMMALSEKQQAFFVGIRSTAFRIALIAANGVLLAIAGIVVANTGPEVKNVEITAKQMAQEEAVAYTDPPPIPEGGEMQILLSTDEMTAPIDGSTTFTVQLSQAPEAGHDEVVVLRVLEQGNIFKKFFLPLGAQGIIVSEDRLVFNSENWNQPREIVVSVDEKTGPNVTTIYQASAGNIPFSWFVVCVSCAILYGFFFLIHSIGMPKPVSDFTESAGRPNILVPLLALGLFLYLPYRLGYDVYTGLTYTAESIRSYFVPEELTELEGKGWDFAFTAAKLLTLTFLASLIFFLPMLRNIGDTFLEGMSSVSGIGFADLFKTFFTKEGIAVTLAFLLTFRLGEAQLAQVKNVFLLDARSEEGLALSLTSLGIVNTIFYIGGLTVGGILGGYVISAFGLKKVIWPMVAAMHLPNFFYVWLAYTLPDTLPPVYLAVGVESMGYGFGFTAYLMIMIMAAQGPYKTAHYALCTGFMALGYMIPGLWSGYLQELVGYKLFFWLVVVFSLPGVFFIPYLPIDPNFGRKETTAEE